MNFFQGVDHFYIYNTIKNSTSANILSDALKDYISEGIVTLISWPYQNCVIGMASGRPVKFARRDQQHLGKMFLGPPRIDQKTALASCYLRHHRRTRFMMIVDDDEFIIVRNDSSVLTFVQEKFQHLPKSAVISFKPVRAGFCPTVSTRDSHFHNLFPRIGRMNKMWRGFGFEGKVIVKTAAVSMISIHNAVQFVSDDWASAPKIIPDFSEAFLLHYKADDYGKPSIFGGILSRSSTATDRMTCNRQDHYLSTFFGSSHHDLQLPTLSYDFISKLAIRYRKRMNLQNSRLRT